MDLVISADTAVAHLAGALGKPLWLLLPADSFSGFVAKLVNRDDSVCYPTARLFTQPEPRDWESVIDKVIEELRTTFPVALRAPSKQRQ
jgi:hypothetical protein